MGSMHTGLEGHSIPKLLLPFLQADDDHIDLTEMAIYFAERAKGGVGLMGAFLLFDSCRHFDSCLYSVFLVYQEIFPGYHCWWSVFF